MAAVIYKPSIELSLKYVEHQLCGPVSKKTGPGHCRRHWRHLSTEFRPAREAFSTKISLLFGEICKDSCILCILVNVFT